MISNCGNKILSFYSDAKKLYNNELVIPRFVSIWLTTVCDLGCNYCYFSALNKRMKQFINTESLYRFIDELADLGVESIEFSGGGEPTLHPDCFDIAKYAVNKGLKVGLLTNGSKFDFERVKYFSFIRVGLDEINAKDYAKMKNCNEDRFNQTIDNISHLVASKNSNNRPRIGVKFMLNSLNYTEIHNMVELARKLNVDYCHFKATHNDKLSISNKLEPGMIKEIESIIKYVEEKNPNFVYGSVLKEELKTKCFMSPIHTVITSNGDLLICCYFNSKKYIVGNVFKDNFSKVWFSKRHIRLLNSITPKQCNKYDCRWSSYNNDMKDIIEQGKYDLAFI